MQQNNDKMEFFYQYGGDEGSVVMTLPPDTTLYEAIEAFETFLRAAGYVFDGQLEISGNIDFDDPLDSDMVDPNAGRN